MNRRDDSVLGRWSGMVLAVLAALFSAPAVAGDGPWVVGKGNASLFLGLEGQRIERLDMRDGMGAGEVMDVDFGISTLGAKVIGTMGVGDRLELELSIPWYQVRANRNDGGICTTIGLSGCRTTEGLGIITARGKGTLVDELYGAPVTFAAGVELRFGQLTADTRARVTNIGEGTMDVGVFSSVGRSARLGEEGTWSGYIDALARYRFPNTRSYQGADGDEVVAPGMEFSFGAKSLFGWNKNVGLGPGVTFYTRPFGLDFGDLSLGDVDRFSALRVSNMQIGAHGFLRANDSLTFSFSLLQTVYARNNPFSTVVSVGVSHFGVLKKER